jgi:hypothetical protein
VSLNLMPKETKIINHGKSLHKKPLLHSNRSPIENKEVRWLL